MSLGRIQPLSVSCPTHTPSEDHGLCVGDTPDLATYKKIAIVGTSIVAGVLFSPLIGVAVQEATSLLITGESDLTHSVKALIQADWVEASSGLIMIGATLAISGGLMLTKLKSAASLTKSTDTFVDGLIVYIDAGPTSELTKQALQIGNRHIKLFHGIKEAEVFINQQGQAVELVISELATSTGNNAGLDFLTKLGTLHPNIKRMLLTAHPQDLLPETLPEKIAFLQRPCTPAQLNAAVDKALK